MKWIKTGLSTWSALSGKIKIVRRGKSLVVISSDPLLMSGSQTFTKMSLNQVKKQTEQAIRLKKLIGPEPKKQKLQNEGGMARILLLDPDPARRRMASICLPGHRVIVVDAKNWAGKALTDSDKFDLVIINEQVGKDTGEARRFARRLYNAHPGLQIIFISSDLIRPVEPGITYVDVFDWNAEKISEIVRYVLAQKTEEL